MNDLVCPIDINTGLLKFSAEDGNGQTYEKHPITGEIIKGFKIPFWKEIIKLVYEASLVVPEVGYVGWDIAITPDKAIIIEGNTSPGYKFYQLPNHLPNGVGNKEIYEKNN
ncbi:sugar-transfer associated ATP-grasp domain-containing protein [Carnobacterium iners]|uniref:sugar-transfer associated ATP-grasp domain-containing protein n=1 Tax=Carnobacterium iners TaxID=1073423 RepID=UPI0008BD71EC|nr:sugar-transfer associated ATP-grasp domain-containing protein [Carnobacterium iners]SEL20306.1 Sugar-transfer associated ATP-grasp [Carnobacterium iners]